MRTHRCRRKCQDTGRPLTTRLPGVRSGLCGCHPGRCAGGRGSHVRPPGPTAEARSSAPSWRDLGREAPPPVSAPGAHSPGRSWSPAGGRGRRSPRSSGGSQPGTCSPAPRAGRWGQGFLPALVSGTCHRLAHRSPDCSTVTRATWGLHRAARGACQRVGDGPH